MTYQLQDLIDLEQFQNLQDRLNEIYSFPSAIIDNAGNVLTATAWQAVCTQFHRKNQDCERDCLQSDQYILSHLHEANPAVSYRCPRGLVDNATPIIIDGVHYGNFFTGQFFLEKPDLDAFRLQARQFGFDEAAYLEAVNQVPVWTKDQLNSYLFFIKGLIAVIAESGLKKLKEIQARQQTEESEERANAILGQMHDGFWIIDPLDGQVLDANEAMCRMLGCSRDELLKMSVAEVEANDSPEMLAQRIQHILQVGSAQFESRYRRKDGTLFDVDVSITYMPLRKLIFGFHRDITARKQAEQALRESEAKFRAVVENSNDGILFGNAQAVIQYRSPSYNRINGYSDEERLGHSGFETVHPDDAKDLHRWWVTMLEQPEIAHKTEYRIRHRDGTWRWIETSGQNLLDNPDVHSVVVTSRDITERKQLEQALAAERDLLEQHVAERTRELAAANVRLQDLDRLKSKFVSEVSHELRTPVTSLTLYLSLLEHGRPEKHAHYLSSATQQADRMKQLIEDILDLSRLERDKADLTVAPIDLNAVLEQAVVAQQPRAETASLKLTFEPSADLPLVRGDIHRLLQVATNLITNAINYTSTGAIQVRSFQRGDRVGFEVQDTGMGIAPEDLAHLGERFYRGQRASQSSVRGTGLGLNIVKEIVDWHGGTLEIQSEVGVGSTFTVWLPLVV